MPELPEVTTTVQGLEGTVLGKIVASLWYDFSKRKQEKLPRDFDDSLLGAKILAIRRRGKNIFVDLSGNKTLHVHLKMTGHLLFSSWKKVNAKAKGERKKVKEWEAKKAGPMRDDPYNQHLRFVITFKDNTMLALCDTRRFAKVGLFETNGKEEQIEIGHLGPEPLSPDFTFGAFVDRLSVKTTRTVKQILLDQKVIAGIGNIYSDEMLFRANIHPKSKPAKIPSRKMRVLYMEMRKVLSLGIDFGGDSMSDYRNIYGERGKFQEQHLAYRRTGLPCKKKGCNGKISREKIGGRSAHFCNKHQVLYT